MIDARCFELDEEEEDAEAGTATALEVEVIIVLAGEPFEVTTDVITRTLVLLELAELTEELLDDEVSKVIDTSVGLVAEAEDVVEELADEEADLEELAADPEPPPPIMIGN